MKADWVPFWNAPSSGTMKKRSEMKKRSATTSAVERTSPLPIEAGERTCEACEVTFDASSGTRRADGSLECPECGAPEGSGSASGTKPVPTPTQTPKTRPGASSAPETTIPPQPVTVETTKGNRVELPRAYCEDCGAEWPRLADGKPFPNCGHANGFTHDPKKAKKYAPPAGHAQLTPKQLDEASARAPKENFSKTQVQLNPKVDTSRPPTNPPTIVNNMSASPDVRVQGNRIHVSWGKASFPVIPGQFGSFNTPDLDVWLELAPGANMVDVALGILPELQRVADEAFKRQLRWYLEKLDLIADATK